MENDITIKADTELVSQVRMDPLWEEFLPYLAEVSTSGYGTPRIELHFPNGYGVSVFREHHAGFLLDSQRHVTPWYELAVLDKEKTWGAYSRRKEWGLTYDTPVTSDVERGNGQTVIELIRAVKDLPPKRALPEPEVE